jgi:hypothetical protein
MTVHEAYTAAMAADEAFEAEIKAAGFKSRWDWVSTDRDSWPGVYITYRLKVLADAALHTAMTD